MPSTAFGRPVDRQAKAAPYPVVAPVGGLNARVALAAMTPEFASVMTNMFPYADRVEVRPGYATLVTASSITMANTDEGFRRIMVHVGGGTETVLAAFYYSEDVAGVARTRVRIYTVAADGTLATSLEVVTLASTDGITAFGEWCLFTSAAGITYLIQTATTRNAASTVFTNTPKAFDGTNWTSPAITGLPEVTMGVHSSRNRLWFYNGHALTVAEKPLSAYYLPTGAIAGAATEFNLGPFANKGGRIVSVRTWTPDNGDGGTDDLTVFVTDQGQVLVYAGTDPSSASTWSLVGVFDVGKLASWRTSYITGVVMGFVMHDAFAMKYGTDVLILTQDGVTSLERIVRGSTNPDEYQLSANIRPLLATAAGAWITTNATNNLASWRANYLPVLQHLFVVVPTGVLSANSKISWLSEMYVMNSATGAWCKYESFQGIDAITARSMLLVIDGAYTIKKFDGSATADVAGATAITFECRQAYNYMNSPVNKLATLMQPMLRTTGNFTLTVEADADFSANDISTYTSYTSGTANVQPWISANKYGRAFAAHLKGQTSAGRVSWYATNWLVRSAGLV